MPPFTDVLARPSDAGSLTANPADEAAALFRLEANGDAKAAIVPHPIDAKKEPVVTSFKDGSKQIAHANGSVVDVNPQGGVHKITRTDGSVISCTYNGNLMNKIVETRGTKNTEWTRDQGADRWRSMDNIGAQRIGFTLNDLGQSSFEDVLGTRYVTHGDASQTRHKADGSTIEIDSNWHVTSVKRADSTKLECKFTGDQMTEVIERGKKGGDVTWTFDPKAEEWTSPQSKDVRKHVSVSDLGNYAYLSALNGDVVHIDYIEGSSREFGYGKGRVNQITENSNVGKVVWTRDADTDTFISGTTKLKRENVAVSLNGDYSYVDDRGFKHIHKFDVTEELILPTDIARTKEFEQARTDLVSTAKTIMTASDLERFTADIDKFEARAHAYRLKDSQSVAVLTELKKILVSTVEKPVITTERVKLAQESLLHVSNPRGSDQGVHDTCGAAGGQVYVCSQYPESFVALIREVADTGKFKTSKGFLITPAADSLKPDWEARVYTPYSKNAWGRTHAGQIFQVVGINAAYAALGSNYTYEQRRPADPKDTGERLLGKTDGKLYKFSGMFDNEVKELTIQTCGHAVTVLRRDTNFTSEAELQTKISDLQKQNQLPAVLTVHTKNEPFWTANGRGRSGSPGGGHYVTIWDIDAAGRILLDNQWGRKNDYESLRRLRVSDVFTATDK